MYKTKYYNILTSIILGNVSHHEFNKFKLIVINLPNAVALGCSSSCCGDLQKQNYFIAVSQL